MEFSFTEEQRAVAELTTDLFGAHGSDEHVRALAQAGITFDRALWGRLVETGLVALALAESSGGSGLGMIELALVLEQQGRFLAAAPLWQHQLASLAIEAHAEPSLRERLLPSLASGTSICAVATEPGNPGALGARRIDSGWVLDGHVDTVLLEPQHSHLLLAATSADGPRPFVVPTDLPGMRRTAGVLTDLQPVSDLRFERALVSPDAALGAAALAWLEPRFDLCVASLQLGVLAEALRRAALYVSERHQFGRPLGSFQALAVRAADAYIEVELLRSVQWQLAWRLDAGLPAAAAGRVAKHQAAKAGHLVAHTVQHFHGGVGTDLTYPIHRFYLRSQALALLGGGQEAELARIGRELAGADHEDYIHE